MAAESYYELRCLLRECAEERAVDVAGTARDRSSLIRARPEWRGAVAIAELVAQRDTLLGEIATLRKRLGDDDEKVDADTLPAR